MMLTESLQKLSSYGQRLMYAKQTRILTKTVWIGALASLCISHSAMAEDRVDLTAPPISFEQILANPDNQDMNLHYASQQAKRGDYLSAASALERMLYSQPNWDSARLFYAVVLEKLDDRTGVIRELELLEGRPLSAHQKTQHADLKRKTSSYASKMGQ